MPRKPQKATEEVAGAPTSATLSPDVRDYVASAARAALGAIPWAGSLLGEMVTSVIPNQRGDRLVKFAAALEQRVGLLEKDKVRAHLHDEHFAELTEEAFRQAARSASDERREEIAALVANSISSDHVTHEETRHLLRVLGEINDIEVVWLRYFLLPFNTCPNGDKEFRAKHREIISSLVFCALPPDARADKNALEESYKEHLTELGLLRKVFRRRRSREGVERVELDERTGSPKIERYEITDLGTLLLRFVGLAAQTWAPGYRCTVPSEPAPRPHGRQRR